MTEQEFTDTAVQLLVSEGLTEEQAKAMALLTISMENGKRQNHRGT